MIMQSSKVKGQNILTKPERDAVEAEWQHSLSPISPLALSVCVQLRHPPPPLCYLLSWISCLWCLGLLIRDGDEGNKEKMTLAVFAQLPDSSYFSLFMPNKQLLFETCYCST